MDQEEKKVKSQSAVVEIFLLTALKAVVGYLVVEICKPLLDKLVCIFGKLFKSKNSDTTPEKKP